MSRVKLVVGKINKMKLSQVKFKIRRMIKGRKNPLVRNESSKLHLGIKKQITILRKMRNLDKIWPNVQ